MSIDNSPYSKYGEMSVNLSLFGFLVGDPIFHEVAGITLVIFVFLFVKSRLSSACFTVSVPLRVE